MYIVLYYLWIVFRVEYSGSEGKNKDTHQKLLAHPGGPSSRCPAWKRHTLLFSSLLTNKTYSNAAPVSLMLRVKRRAFD